MRKSVFVFLDTFFTVVRFRSALTVYFFQTSPSRFAVALDGELGTVGLEHHHQSQ
jgi:hypothetical protein